MPQRLLKRCLIKLFNVVDHVFPRNILFYPITCAQAAYMISVTNFSLSTFIFKCITSSFISLFSSTHPLNFPLSRTATPAFARSLSYLDLFFFPPPIHLRCFTQCRKLRPMFIHHLCNISHLAYIIATTNIHKAAFQGQGFFSIWLGCYCICH